MNTKVQSFLAFARRYVSKVLAIVAVTLATSGSLKADTATIDTTAVQPVIDSGKAWIGQLASYAGVLYLAAIGVIMVGIIFVLLKKCLGKH